MDASGPEPIAQVVTTTARVENLGVVAKLLGWGTHGIEG